MSTFVVAPTDITDCSIGFTPRSWMPITVGANNIFNVLPDKVPNPPDGDSLFIRFQNKVCTNLCVWTDGLMDDIKVMEKDTLTMFIYHLLERYRVAMHLNALKDLANYHLTEKQFAHFIGKCRMYQYLPKKEKQKVQEIALGDQQISIAARGYYEDPNFGKHESGDINLWSLYNLLTGANKTTYIDQFGDRSSNAFDLMEGVKYSLQGKCGSWYLN
jgi:Domain of unknown function, B. Theta Gene description (DUF3871)